MSGPASEAILAEPRRELIVSRAPGGECGKQARETEQDQNLYGKQVEKLMSAR